MFYLYFSDGLLDVEIDSELREIPNFIQRALGARDIKVGVYEPTGIPIESTKVDERQVNIRPLKPFGINPKLFGKLYVLLLCIYYHYMQVSTFYGDYYFIGIYLLNYECLSAQLYLIKFSFPECDCNVILVSHDK